jgi:hypothetical protein
MTKVQVLKSYKKCGVLWELAHNIKNCKLNNHISLHSLVKDPEKIEFTKLAIEHANDDKINETKMPNFNIFRPFETLAEKLARKKQVLFNNPL